jgi:hypothetical protein
MSEGPRSWPFIFFFFIISGRPSLTLQQAGIFLAVMLEPSVCYLSWTRAPRISLAQLFLFLTFWTQIANLWTGEKGGFLPSPDPEASGPKLPRPIFLPAGFLMSSVSGPWAPSWDAFVQAFDFGPGGGILASVACGISHTLHWTRSPQILFDRLALSLVFWICFLHSWTGEEGGFPPSLDPPIFLPVGSFTGLNSINRPELDRSVWSPSVDLDSTVRPAHDQSIWTRQPDLHTINRSGLAPSQLVSPCLEAVSPCLDMASPCLEMVSPESIWTGPLDLDSITRSAHDRSIWTRPPDLHTINRTVLQISSHLVGFRSTEVFPFQRQVSDQLGGFLVRESRSGLDF